MRWGGLEGREGWLRWWGGHGGRRLGQLVTSMRSGGLQLSSLFFMQSGTPAHGIVCPNLEWVFTPHLSQSRNSPTVTWCISRVVPSPIRLAFKINGHRLPLICDVILGTLSHHGGWVWGTWTPGHLPHLWLLPASEAAPSETAPAIHCGSSPEKQVPSL